MSPHDMPPPADPGPPEYLSNGMTPTLRFAWAVLAICSGGFAIALIGTMAFIACARAEDTPHDKAYVSIRSERGHVEDVVRFYDDEHHVVCYVVTRYFDKSTPAISCVKVQP